MGPSVKFVSAIKDAFFNKKNGGQFFSREKDQTRGGGSEGGLVKDHTFPEIFFLNLSLTHFFCYLGRVVKKKLQRAAQQKLEMDKEKRERSHPSEASILILQVLNWLWGKEEMQLQDTGSNALDGKVADPLITDGQAASGTLF